MIDSVNAEASPRIAGLGPAFCLAVLSLTQLDESHVLFYISSDSKVARAMHMQMRAQAKSLGILTNFQCSMDELLWVKWVQCLLDPADHHFGAFEGRGPAHLQTQEEDTPAALCRSKVRLSVGFLLGTLAGSTRPLLFDSPFGFPLSAFKGASWAIV